MSDLAGLTVRIQSPDFTAVSIALLLVLLAWLVSSNHLFSLGRELWFAPGETASSLIDMASFKLSQLAKHGFGSLGELNWDNLPLRTSDDDDDDEFGRAYNNGSSSSDFDFATQQSNGDASSSSRKLSVSAGNGLYYPGLLNAAGNLCFLNATLQSMASQPSLISYLRKITIEAQLVPTPVACPVTTTLLRTLDALNTPTRSPRPLRPVELATALARSSKTRMQLLRSNDQQDAHELWIMIHEAVQEEVERISKAAQKSSRGAGLADAMLIGNKMTLAGRTGLNRAKRRKLTDPYMILTSQEIRCLLCGYTRDVRHIAEDQLVLTVPFMSGCSLVQLLAEYTKPELLSEYACRACCIRATQSKLHAQLDRLSQPASTAETHIGNNGNAATTTTKSMTSSRKERRRKVAKLVETIDRVVQSSDFEKELGESIKVERVTGAAAKQVKFARGGDVLTLHLNRSTHMGLGMGAGGAYKNSATVLFPEYLDLAPFVDDHRGRQQQQQHQLLDEDKGKANSAGIMYRLASLVVHYGTHSFGHYVAFRRAPQNASSSKWFRISDETVEECSIDTVLASNPFLLFYERVRTRDSPFGDVVDDADDVESYDGSTNRTITPNETRSSSQQVEERKPFARQAVQRWQIPIM